jgi:hypothetical protein
MRRRIPASEFQHVVAGTQNLYWNAGNDVWNNTGDKAKLKKASGTKVDVFKFTGAGGATPC